MSKIEDTERQYNALSVQLLDNHLNERRKDDLKERLETGRRMEAFFRKNNLKLSFEDVYSASAVYGFSFFKEDDINLESVRALRDEIRVETGSKSVRIFTLDNRIIIELSTPVRYFPSLKDILSFTPMYQDIPLILGEGENGRLYIEDVTNIDNLLVGGSDKEEVLNLANIFITTLLYRRSSKDVKLVLIGEAFKKYNGIANLLCPVVTKKEDVITALIKIRTEMHMRIDQCYSAGLGNQRMYNNVMGEGKMPSIVVLVDKLGREISEIGSAMTKFISDIAQRGRYAGIYIIGFVNTSRLVEYPVTLPNILHRIAFHTDNEKESKLLLGNEEAFSLLKEGDMLLSGFSSADRRIQAPLITEGEIKRVLREVKNRSLNIRWEKDEDYINL